ncbi:MAG: hypothetical protein RLZZ241_410 [Bacteroidota bacterium]
MNFGFKSLLRFSLILPLFLNSQTDTLRLSRTEYGQKLQGFWLAECIANWTGLVTEMDKIGNIGEIQTGDFYTREDWGKPDQPSIFDPENISPWSKTIDFVFRGPDEIWGADDDTDIEYMYQYLMATQNTPVLSGNQIREGWLKHIRTEEENYLWVSNQQALDLMQEGIIPPETSNPDINPDYDMIDAQLTTEIFGLLAPGRPDLGLKMAYLPIRTTARKEAASISEFYVHMHALAAIEHSSKSMKERLFTIASKAREHLPENEFPAKMYDFVKAQYDSGIPWEAARDAIYERYQVKGEDGYDVTSRNLYCNGCFAAGINFAASLVSLFYGEGDLKETLKIGVLCGWDSDNPTATWGGLLGFMLGKSGVEATFNRKFSNRFNIHRTRQNFPDNGIDTFENMAQMGQSIIDLVVKDLAAGNYDSTKDEWLIPLVRE